VTDAQKKWREDLAAQVTAKDKDAETKITTVLEQAKQAETRAAFAELAHGAGIADIRAAWAVVKEYGLANDKGVVDFNKLKDAHPALFAPAKSTEPAVAEVIEPPIAIPAPPPPTLALKIAFPVERLACSTAPEHVQNGVAVVAGALVARVSHRRVVINL
jgi:hypothetical protein